MFSIEDGQRNFLLNRKVELLRDLEDEHINLYTIFIQKLEGLYNGSLYVPAYDSDADLENLINHGVLFGKTEYLVKGRPSNCHQNSVDYYLNHIGEGYNIYTGYALSEDGLWRQHTWIVDLDGLTYETTVERIAYYGFKLKGDGLRKFIGGYI